MPASHRRSRRSPLRGAGLLLLPLLTAALSACDSLTTIDRKIDELVRERSRTLGVDAYPPEQDFIDPEKPGRDATETLPLSINPAATDLEFDPAPPVDIDARLARLDAYSEISESGRLVTLADAWQIAQEFSRDYLAAEEDYLLASIRLLIERHLWGPRLFNDTTLNVNSFPQGVAGGSYRTALNIINTLRATQRLPYGGEVEARWIVTATEQLRDVSSGNYIQSSSLVLSANVPLLRGAGLIAREDLIQAERDLVYAAREFEEFRRQFLVDVAQQYFNLVLLQNAITNQEIRLESVRRLQVQEEALAEAGRKPAFDANNVRQNVLRSQNQLTNSREQFVVALDRFKILLGLPVEAQIRLQQVDIELLQPSVTPGVAAQRALLYRLDFQNTLDRLEDSERAVANARNNILPDLDVSAALILNTQGEERAGGIVFDDDETEWNVSATFSLPLDRQIERLNLRAATINLQRSRRNVDQFRDNVILDARQAVREIDRAIVSLDLQNESIRINELRLEELEIKADEIDPQTRLDAENELLDSRNARDQAVRDVRLAILNYLLSTGQLRVADDGTFLPIEGLVIQPAPGEPGARGILVPTGPPEQVARMNPVEDGNPGP